MNARLLLILCAASLAAQEPPSAKPLTIDELLASVDRAFPLIEAVVAERRLAEGAATAARGEFDLKLKGEAESQQFGYYRNEMAKGMLEQNTTLWGTTVYGGYRVGRGTYGPYDEKALTLSGGEWSGGFRMPLFKDREIDSRRAGLQTTELGIQGAEFTIAKERLKIYKSALKQYWEWVAAGRQIKVAQDLLTLAEQRNQQLEDTVKLGQLAPVELTDNLRAILQRRSALVNAERYLQGAGIELSLFFRNAAGDPLQPAQERMMPFPEPEPLTPEQEASDTAAAMTARPEIQSLLIKRQQQSVETRFAKNQVQPQLDFYFNYSRDVGAGRLTRRGNEIEGGLLFELPAQRRKALGKQTQAEAKLTMIDAELRFTRDRVLLDVQDAASAVRAAYQVVSVIRDEVKAARQLEEAERARFDLGDSTQFFVNQRELATADAAFREIKALADYHKARAEYAAATARLLERKGP
jgi:cobalt-zinc-cadmium efflux system outer membrane protein